MQVVIISGLSGSGKSVALNVLEDASFYCVDNLPATLLSATVDFLAQAGYERVAISVDARSGLALAELPASVRRLKAIGVDVRLLFLDAKNETLIKRFSETRRRHPVAGGDATLDEAIARERELLEEVGELGQRIDTSDLAPNTLRAWIRDVVAIDRSGMTLAFESFGFKQGIPLDADLVFDVRCLPNPFYDPKLRPLTGLDEEVIRFLDAVPAARGMLADIGDKNSIYAIAGEAAALVGPIDILIQNASTLGPVPLRLLLDTDCEDLERASDPGLPVDGESPESRPAHQDRLRADRERDRDVGSTPDPSVEQHRNPAVDGLHDLGKSVDRRRCVVELPAAMIGDHNPGGAVLHGQRGVLAGDQALDQDRQLGRLGELRRFGKSAMSSPSITGHW